jgi:hypothetical protein
MILSPLPAHQRKRHFHLFHGELMEEDEPDEEEEEEEIDDDEDESSSIIIDDEPEAVAVEVSAEVSEVAVAKPAE